MVDLGLPETLRRYGTGRLGIVLGLTAVWWACAVGVTVILKAALTRKPGVENSALGTFPYPLTLTLFANIGTAAATGLFSLLVNGRQCLTGVSPDRNEPITPRGHVLRVTSREALLREDCSSSRFDSPERDCQDSGVSAFSTVNPSGRMPGLPTATGGFDGRNGLGPGESRFGAGTILTACCGSKPRRAGLWGSRPSSPTAQASESLEVIPAPEVGERASSMTSWLCRECHSRLAVVLSGGKATIAVIGLLQGLALGVKNEALLLLSVSTRTMIFATNVLAVMLIARLCGLEALRRTKLVSAVLLAAGGMLQGIATVQHMKSDDRSDSAAGCMLALLALVLDALRWVLLQAVFMIQDALPIESSPMHDPSPSGHHPPLSSGVGEGGATVVAGGGRRPPPQFTKFTMVSLVMWMATPVCILLSVIFEPDGLRQAWAKPVTLLRIVGLLTIGVMGINLAEFGVVQWTSAVTFNVLAQLHSIPMVLAGVLCFGEEVAAVQGIGFAVCLLGAMLYSWARAREKHMPHMVQGTEHDHEPSCRQPHGPHSIGGMEVVNNGAQLHCGSPTHMQM